MTPPTQADHFLFNSSLFAPKLRMMLRGIRVDQSKLEELKAEAAAGVWRLQSMIDGVVAALQSHARTPEVKLLDYLYAGLNEEQFAKLCLSCLGGSNPRVRREVTVERWQPMRWNGRKWVKAGRMLDTRPAPYEYIEQDTEPAQSDDKWLKPAHKTVSRLQSFTPSTLAEVEPHVLESKRAEWRRVKQIWKELKDDSKRTDRMGREISGGAAAALSADSGCSPGSLERAALDVQKGGDPVVARTDGVAGAERLLGALGELSTLLGLAVNAGSTSEGGDSQWFLYEVCGLPRMYCDARTGRYSRETETEWRKRTKEGVRHERKQRRKTAKEAGPVVETSDDVEGIGAGGQGGDAGGMDTVPKGNPAGESAKSSKRISTDQVALVRLYAHSKDVRLLWVLQQRRLRKVVTDLSTKLDPDGRLRASISLVKETGRMSESAAPTGCGLNRQALNKDLLSICIPDEGYEMARLDLEGADSWTVACEAAALGDPTMLDDLKAGIKPAQVVGLIYLNGVKVNEWPRESIKQRLSELAALPWLYPGAKATAHESPYGGGWETTQMILLKNSMADLPLDLKDSKPIVLSKKQIDDLQGAFFSRYPGVRKWQQKVGQQLMEKGWLAASTGHVRRFYGRKVEIKAGRKVVNHSTLREALSSMPQYYTTYSIKQAWLKMWEDEENWRSCIHEWAEDNICNKCHANGEDRIHFPGKVGYGVQIVEPLALKHDEILMQWRKEDRAWALKKLPEWFRTPVRIAGIEVVIPAAGKIGNSWAMTDGKTLKL